MKKAFLMAGLFCLFFFSFPLDTFAAQRPPSDLFEASRAEDLSKSLPKETRDLLDSMGIQAEDLEGLSQLSPKKIFRSVGNLLKENSRGPIKTVVEIVGILLLCSLVKNLRPGGGNLESFFSTASALFIGTLLVGQAISCVTQAGSVLQLCAKFSLAYIPVFAAIVAASGNPAVALGYNTAILAVSQLLSNVISHLVFPFLSVFMALGIVSSLKPEYHLQAIPQFIKKYTVWFLSLASTLFFSFLTLKSNIAVSLDNLGGKGVKFAVNTFIPVVGSALSEGLSSLQGYLQLMKSGVGIFGILAVLVLFLPTLLELVCWIFSLGFCSMCCDLFDDGTAGMIVKTVQSALSLLLVITILCAALFIISTGIILMMRS